MTTESDIRFITRYYESLCGLINLPIALFLMMMASQEFFPGPLAKRDVGAFTLPLMVLMFLAMIPITRYYRRRYGSVQVQHPGRYFLFVMIAIVTIMLAGWIDGLLERNFRFPVSLYVLTVAVWMFLGGQNRRRWYYRVTLGSPWPCSSLFPAVANLLGLAPYESPLNHLFNGLFNLTLGLGIGIVGILDHLLLTRMLRPVQEVAPNAQPS